MEQNDRELQALLRRHETLAREHARTSASDQTGPLSQAPTDEYNDLGLPSEGDSSVVAQTKRYKRKGEICPHQSKIDIPLDVSKQGDEEEKEEGGNLGVGSLDEDEAERVAIMEFEVELLSRESSVLAKEDSMLNHAKALRRYSNYRRLIEFERAVLAAEAENVLSHKSTLLAFQDKLERESSGTRDNQEEELVDVEALEKAVQSHKAELEKANIEHQNEERRLRDMRRILKRKEAELEDAQRRVDEELERVMQKRKHLASIEERLDQKDRVQKENTKLLLEKSRDSVVQVKMLAEQKAALDRRDLLVSEKESRLESKEKALQARELKVQESEREVERKNHQMEIEKANISNDIRLLETQRKYLELQKTKLT